MENKQNGFTIIETLIYAFVFAIILTAFVSVVVASILFVNKLRITTNITNAATASLERMTRDVRQGSGFDISGNTFDTSPGELTINIIDPETEVVTVEHFYISNGDLFVQKDGGPSLSVLPEGIVVDSLIFRKIESGTLQGVKIEMSIYDERDNTKVKNFYTSVVFRQGE